MNQPEVQPATGYLVNIVDENFEVGDFGVKVNINYLIDYKVLIFTIERWGELWDFSIKRALCVEGWPDALHLSGCIKEMAFKDYKFTEESDLISQINDFIRNLIES